MCSIHCFDNLVMKQRSLDWIFSCFPDKNHAWSSHNAGSHMWYSRRCDFPLAWILPRVRGAAPKVLGETACCYLVNRLEACVDSRRFMCYCSTSGDAESCGVMVVLFMILCFLTHIGTVSTVPSFQQFQTYLSWVQVIWDVSSLSQCTVPIFYEFEDRCIRGRNRRVRVDQWWPELCAMW